MFAPPPTPALSRAEIQNLRAQARQKHDGVDQHAETTSVGTYAQKTSTKESERSGVALTTTTPLIRKADIFGLAKIREKARHGFEISAPLPLRSPPISQLSYLDATTKSQASLPPLPLPSSPQPSTHTHPSKESLLTHRSNSSMPPKRPPRPANGLSIDPPLIPAYSSNIAAEQLLAVGSNRSAHHSEHSTPDQRHSSSSQDSHFSNYKRRSSSDCSGRSVATSASSQVLITSKQSSGGHTRNKKTRLLGSQSESAKSIRSRTTSSLESALIGLGGVPGQTAHPGRFMSERPTTSAKTPITAREAHAKRMMEKALPQPPRDMLQAQGKQAPQETTPQEQTPQHRKPQKQPPQEHLPQEANGSDVQQKAHGTRAARNGPLTISLPTGKSSNLPAKQSKHRLSAIPEYFSRESAPNSTPGSPVETHIRLRGGSLVTVTPPELSAWKRSIYLQGPIRLTKPAILPRKNSLASLEPFQDAVNDVYRAAMGNLRRQSDEITARDVCDFFIAFGTCDVYPDLSTQVVAGDTLGEEDEELELDTDVDLYATPPDSPEVLAAPEHQPVLAIPLELPPLETEETLRARGIARLRRAPKTIQCIPKVGTMLTLVPLPEDSILEAVLANLDKRPKYEETSSDEVLEAAKPRASVE